MGLGRLTVAVCVAAAVCTAAACGGPQRASSNSRRPTPATAAGIGTAKGHGGSAAASVATTECRNSPPTVVGGTLGLRVGAVTASVEGPVTVCAYAGRYEVIVRYQTGETAGAFAQDRRSMARLHQSVSSVDDLGDEAFFAVYRSSGPPSDTLAARKGDIAVFITSPAALGPERALMVKLLAKL